MQKRWFAAFARPSILHHYSFAGHPAPSTPAFDFHPLAHGHFHYGGALRPGCYCAFFFCTSWPAWTFTPLRNGLNSLARLVFFFGLVYVFFHRSSLSCYAHLLLLDLWPGMSQADEDRMSDNSYRSQEALRALYTRLYILLVAIVSLH